MKSELLDEQCLIIGAGMAGLLAGEVLAGRGVSVVILDKGRTVGGRMSTRRHEAGLFDHGAQFLTARDKRFARKVGEWSDRGLIREWCRHFARVEGAPAHGSHPRYCGVSGMEVVPQYLARKLHVHTSETVVSLTQSHTGWEAITAKGNRFHGGAVLLTPPVPQSLALLDASEVALPRALRTSLEAIEYDACIAVLALLKRESRIPLPGCMKLDKGPVAWIADNRMKGISPGAHAVTLHGSPEFSKACLDADLVLPAEELMAAASRWIGTDIMDYQVHRWRYSRPVCTADNPYLFLSSPAPLVFAGDAFVHPSVEGAALSGLAAADYLLKERFRGKPVQLPWYSDVIASDGA